MKNEAFERTTTACANSGAGSGGTRGVAIAMYCVLLASYSVNAADRQLFPLLAHDVRLQFGFSLSDVGLLSTIFTLGLAIAGLPTGFLLSRFSRKTVSAAGNRNLFGGHGADGSLHWIPGHADLSGRHRNR